jgi:hypothetical protein
VDVETGLVEAYFYTSQSMDSQQQQHMETEVAAAAEMVDFASPRGGGGSSSGGGISSRTRRAVSKTVQFVVDEEVAENVEGLRRQEEVEAEEEEEEEEEAKITKKTSLSAATHYLDILEARLSKRRHCLVLLLACSILALMVTQTLAPQGRLVLPSERSISKMASRSLQRALAGNSTSVSMALKNVISGLLQDLLVGVEQQQQQQQRQGVGGAETEAVVAAAIAASVGNNDDSLIR